MPAERLSMRHLRELLRLRHSSGLSQYAIARSLGLAQGTVSKYLWRARQAGLSWPLPVELDEDDRLEARLFPPPLDLPPDKRRKPDWAEVHRELRRADVTLALLWEEYKAREPDGFSYSWFCDLYKEWAGRLKPTLRQVHVAGEKLFVDYAGRTMEVIDGATGEARTAQIFVAVLGASSYTYAEATFTQSLPDWIGSHALHLGLVARFVGPGRDDGGAIVARQVGIGAVDQGFVETGAGDAGPEIVADRLARGPAEEREGPGAPHRPTTQPSTAEPPDRMSWRPRHTAHGHDHRIG